MGHFSSSDVLLLFMNNYGGFRLLNSDHLKVYN